MTGALSGGTRALALQSGEVDGIQEALPGNGEPLALPGDHDREAPALLGKEEALEVLPGIGEGLRAMTGDGKTPQTLAGDEEVRCHVDLAVLCAADTAACVVLLFTTSWCWCCLTCADVQMCWP